MERAKTHNIRPEVETMKKNELSEATSNILIFSSVSVAVRPPVASLPASPPSSISSSAPMRTTARSAFASGDRGGISASDEQAMRDSGLTHLLSISGLHVSAVIAAVVGAAVGALGGYWAQFEQPQALAQVATDFLA